MPPRRESRKVTSAPSRAPAPSSTLSPVERDSRIYVAISCISHLEPLLAFGAMFGLALWIVLGALLIAGVEKAAARAVLRRR